MAKISKILLAIDVVGEKRRLCDYTAMLARIFNAEVHAVYVVSSMRKYVKLTGNHEGVTDLREEAMRNAREMLDKAVAKHMPDTKVVTHVLGGESPASPLLNFARTEYCDLIVIGTRNRKGMGSILFGSVAEKILQLAEIPVMTIAPDAAQD